MTASTLVGDNANRLLVSAPGKVILFGEHAVVHQKLAVAASLGLRAYLYIEKTQDGLCHLNLPDVKVNARWSLSDLPHDAGITDSDDAHPLDMPAAANERLNALVGKTTMEAQSQAILAFLYLVIVLSAKGTLGTATGFKITVRSFVPVGAGLGSSACYSVVLATALLILYGHIPADFRQSAQVEEHLKVIDRYAFKAEQMNHGNPSGVDNAVATFGGAKSFRRGQGFATLEGFQALRLLLINTKVPRSTGALVAGVTAKKQAYPEIIDPILDSIDAISLRCCDAFKRYQDGKLQNNALIGELKDLVDINHCLLHALGVSHSSLENVRNITGKYGIKTKLTGAGGGGCALSILGDDVSQEAVDNVTAELAAQGYDCYETSLGGVGVSVVALDENHDEAWLLGADRETLEKQFA